jgi:hypothetical protein
MYYSTLQVTSCYHGSPNCYSKRHAGMQDAALKKDQEQAEMESLGSLLDTPGKT